MKFDMHRVARALMKRNYFPDFTTDELTLEDEDGAIFTIQLFSDSGVEIAYGEPEGCQGGTVPSEYETVEQRLLNAYADGRRDERQDRESWEANVRGLQDAQLNPAQDFSGISNEIDTLTWTPAGQSGRIKWGNEAMKPETADSVQASAIAENQSMQIPRAR